ncbi:hypothetical protein IWW50_006253, partial [Coemansia erecta]
AHVSQGYPSLVRLATHLEAVLGTLKTATQQLSKSGVTRDISVLAQLPETLPILDMLGELETLQTELNEAQGQMLGKEQGGVLGLRDRKVVAQALDLVVLFEVQPRLAAGVGVPASKRLSSNASSVMSSLLRLPSGRRNWRPSASATLSQITGRLARIIEQSRVSEGDVGSMLANKYHMDMIAALLLLAYAPLPPVGVPVPAYVESDPERRTQLRRSFTRL